MTMEPIQNSAVTYQGSASPAEKTAKPAATAKESNATISGSKDAKTDGKNQGMVVSPEVASERSIKNAVEEINRKSQNMEAIFGYHEGTNRVMIKILDKDTREVKKEYPAEKTLDMIQKVWEMAGLMVDEKR